MKKCEHCGSNFEPKNNAQRFCSADCRTIYNGAYTNRYTYDRKKYYKPRKTNKPKKDYNSGTVSCLRCDKQFKSWDKTLNRVCPRCKTWGEDVSVGVDVYFLDTPVASIKQIEQNVALQQENY